MMNQSQAHQLRPLSTPALPARDGLKRAIGLSLGAHALVLAFFTLRMVIFPSEPLMLENAIRVDIVALPDKGPKLPSVPVVETEIPPPSPAPPEPAPVEAAKPEPVKVEPAKVPPPKAESPKVDLNKTKNTQEAALKRLEALERIEKMSQSSANAKAAAAAKPQPIKGNQISRGGSLSGVVRLEHQGYLQTIDGSVKAHWNLPGFLSNSDLKARARLYISPQGVVIKRTLTQSSRNDIYDSRVLAAIDAASPLPAPPSTLSGILETDGIELEFVPQ